MKIRKSKTTITQKLEATIYNHEAKKIQEYQIRTVGARPANLAQKKQENHHLVFKFDKNLA